MHYDGLKNDHGLPHDPINALVSPRPIGWVSTLGKDGKRNLAPYSYFNLIAQRPALVLLASAGRKDSQRNIEETGEFVCNLANWDLREEMNLSAVEAPLDEFDFAGLEPAPSKLVKPPRVARAKAALECRYIQTVQLPRDAEGAPHFFALIIGMVVAVYIDEAIIRDGAVDETIAKPIARLGANDYSVVTETFEMIRPKPPQR